MNNGVAEQIGTPLEVYENPQTLFAAQFIGSPAMNVFDGRVQAGTLSLADGSDMAVNASYEGVVKAGIRPEHLQIAEQGPIAMDVTYAEPLGATTLLHGVITGSNNEIVVSAPGVYRMKSEYKTDAGAIDRVRLQPNNIHLFDNASGQRIN